MSGLGYKTVPTTLILQSGGNLSCIEPITIKTNVHDVHFLSVLQKIQSINRSLEWNLCYHRHTIFWKFIHI